MSRFVMACTLTSFFLSAALASAQSEPARKLIVKVDPGDLPGNARLRLGRLGGFRYDGSFTTAAMSPDGARLAVASNDSSITVLDPASGKIIQRFQQPLIGGAQGGMAFSGVPMPTILPSRERTGASPRLARFRCLNCCNSLPLATSQMCRL
jgi:hypothetical protein